MSLELYLAFVLAVIVLILVPGPNVALIVANSIGRGLRYGLATVAGTSAAMVVQLAVVIAGMTGLTALLADAFEALRWLGVAYLAWLGLWAWISPAQDLTQVTADDRTIGSIMLGGFLVSLSNPKTLFFYAAFLPQFVSESGPRLPQLLVLAGTFLAIAVVLDSAWALLAARVRTQRWGRTRALNRVTGTLLLGAAAGLALARRS